MIKQFAKMTAIGALMLGGTVFAMDYAFSIPVVYKSYSTNRCVKVENYPGLLFGKEVYDCGNLPSKYELTWTE